MTRFFLFQIYFLIATVNSAQTVFELPREEKRKSDLQPRFFLSTALGPVSPTEVNLFIDRYIVNKIGSSYISFGSSDISAVGLVGLGLSIPISKVVQTKTFLEYAGASKTVRLDNTTERFAINRFAPVVLIDYYFFTSGFSSVYIEGGTYYGFTSFRRTEANGLGWRFALGYSWHRPQTIWELSFGVDFPEKNANESTNQISTIDLAAPLFGFRIIF